jgi:hypothetical protein
VIDAENHLIGILTESGILQFLHKNIKAIDLATKSVAELHLDHGRYVSIRADQKAIDAFTLIHNEVKEERITNLLGSLPLSFSTSMVLLCLTRKESLSVT